jgi:PST family polysaccharide transporter
MHRLMRLKARFSVHAGLWENLASLYTVHLSNYVVPLFTLPYLARILGVDGLGLYAVADAYSRIVALIIEYGFSLSATRDIAQLRHDPLARGRHLSAVLAAQLILAGAALLFTLALAFGRPAFGLHGRVLLCAYLLALSQGMNPMWYFLGIERTRLIGGLWIAGRIAGAVVLLVVVRSAQDVWVALLVQGIAPMIVVLAGVLAAYRDSACVRPTAKSGWNALRAGRTIFLTRAGSTMFSSANVLILGLLASPSSVALFSGADRIARAAVSALTPLTQAFFVRINSVVAVNRRDASRTARFSLRIMAILGLAVGTLLFVAAPMVVKLVLGAGYSGSVIILRILTVLPLLAGIGDVVGVQWMLSLRLDSEFNRTILASGVVGVALSFLLGEFFQGSGVAVSAVSAQALLTIVLFAMLRRQRLDPWQPLPDRAAGVAA